MKTFSKAFIKRLGKVFNVVDESCSKDFGFVRTEFFDVIGNRDHTYWDIGEARYLDNKTHTTVNAKLNSLVPELTGANVKIGTYQETGKCKMPVVWWRCWRKKVLGIARLKLDWDEPSQYIFLILDDSGDFYHKSNPFDLTPKEVEALTPYLHRKPKAKAG